MKTRSVSMFSICISIAISAGSFAETFPLKAYESLHQFQMTRDARWLDDAIDRSRQTASNNLQLILSNSAILLRETSPFLDETYDEQRPKLLYMHATPPVGYRVGTSPEAVTDPNERKKYEARIRDFHRDAQQQRIQKSIRELISMTSSFFFGTDALDKAAAFIQTNSIPHNVAFHLLIETANVYEPDRFGSSSVFDALLPTLLKSSLTYCLTNSSPGYRTETGFSFARIRRVVRSDNPVQTLQKLLSSDRVANSTTNTISSFREMFQLQKTGQLLVLDGKHVSLLESQARFLSLVRSVRNPNQLALGQMCRHQPDDFELDDIEYAMSKIWKESFDRYVRWGLLDEEEQRRLQKLAAGEPLEAEKGDETER